MANAQVVARTEAWIEQGLALQEQGKSSAAEEFYSKVLRKDPANVTALYLMGTLHLDGGNLVSAVSHLRKAVRRDPDFVQAQATLGDVQMILGSYEQAAEALGRAVALDPSLIETRNSLGVALHAIGDFEGAVAAFRGVLDATPEFAAAEFSLGLSLASLQRWSEAETHFTNVAPVMSDQAELHLRLGEVRCAQGRHDEAVQDFLIAQRLNPRGTVAIVAEATALLAQLRFEEAIATCKRALAIDPNNAEARFQLAGAWAATLDVDSAQKALCAAGSYRDEAADAYFLQGETLREAGKPHDAYIRYLQSTACRPDSGRAWSCAGAMLGLIGRFTDSETAYRRAARLEPERTDYLASLGVLLSDRGRYAEAAEVYREALAIRPDDPNFTTNLGAALYDSNRRVEAVEFLRKAVELNPENADALSNLGGAQYELGDPEHLTHLRRAVEVRPNFPHAYTNLGYALSGQGEWEEAVECFDKALAQDPTYAQARFNRSMARLCQGQYEEGWRDYEARLDVLRVLKRPFEQPIWDGSDIREGALLVTAEQGFGDTIQFVRYLPLVKRRARRVVFECQAELIETLRGCAGFDEIIVRKPDFSAPDIPFDAHISLPSLPGLFRTTEAAIPSESPYVSIDPKREEAWRDRLTEFGGLRVGLRWAGNPEFRLDFQRSCRLEDLAPLTEAPGVTFFSLQKDARAEEAASPPPGMRLVDFTADLNDFQDTAALMSNLDLVISTCTSVAHLAGAIGAPTWLALKYSADWRWLLNREDSPWYPAARLFRQPSPGDWASVFGRMAQALADRIPALPQG